MNLVLEDYLDRSPNTWHGVELFYFLVIRSILQHIWFYPLAWFYGWMFCVLSYCSVYTLHTIWPFLLDLKEILKMGRSRHYKNIKYIFKKSQV
jgi:hypothetical protein